MIWPLEASRIAWTGRREFNVHGCSCSSSGTAAPEREVRMPAYRPTPCARVSCAPRNGCLPSQRRHHVLGARELLE
jgi:hypothetical protein